MNRLHHRIRLLLILLFLVTLTAKSATTWNAPSGAWIDVSNTVAHASYGDTVQIPAGTWTWTTPNLLISGITLAGAGTNATFITDGMAAAEIAYLLNVITVTNAMTRVTGITFQDAGVGAGNWHGKLEFNGMNAGPASAWRCDHCSFVGLQGINIFVHGFAIGVVDHCSFFLRAEGVGQYGINAYAHDSYGDISYAMPPTYGTTNALYVESCYFTNILANYSAMGAYDGYAGARVVFRNNILDRCCFATHGNDTSGRYRSVRSYEIYNNKFTHNQDFVTVMDFRGGTGVVWSNTATGYKLFDTIENYRNVEANTWGGVTGINPWDSNSPTNYFTGTNSGISGGTVAVGSLIGAGTITVDGANWTPNQWKGYVFYDANAGAYNAPGGIFYNAGINPMCLIQGNSANQLFLTAPKDYILLTTNGDVFSIYYAGASLDQVGRGSGDLIVEYNPYPKPTYPINSVTGTPSWPRQALEPLYSWGNTLNGNPSGISSSYTSVIEGRDIYFNAVKPGYTPLTFPHPLTLLGGGTNTIPPVDVPPTTNTTPPVNTNTTSVLAPPTGLSVFKQ